MFSFLGGSSYFHDIHNGSAYRVCGNRTNLHRLEESELQGRRHCSPQKLIHSLNTAFVNRLCRQMLLWEIFLNMIGHSKVLCSPQQLIAAKFLQGFIHAETLLLVLCLWAPSFWHNLTLNLCYILQMNRVGEMLHCIYMIPYDYRFGTGDSLKVCC